MKIIPHTLISNSQRKNTMLLPPKSISLNFPLLVQHFKLVPRQNRNPLIRTNKAQSGRKESMFDLALGAERNSYNISVGLLNFLSKIHTKASLGPHGKRTDSISISQNISVKSSERKRERLRNSARLRIKTWRKNITWALWKEIVGIYWNYLLILWEKKW